MKLERRRVTPFEAERFASKHKMLYFETSAQTGEGIHEAVQTLADQIIQTPSLWETYSCKLERRRIRLEQYEKDRKEKKKHKSKCC